VNVRLTILDWTAGRIGSWHRLSRPTRFVLGAAALGLIISLAAFAVTIDDVIERNGLTRQDSSRLSWFVHHRPEWLLSVARWFTDTGSVPVLLVLGLGAGFLFYRRGHGLVVAVTPLIALLTAGALTAVLKPMVGRVRPPIGLRLLPETEPSFPSGHATDSTALFVSLALVVAVFVFRRPLARAAALAAGFAIAGLIGLTRLVFGVHWPTDVIAGWALGTAVALVVAGACIALARGFTEHRDDVRNSLRLP
jgi:undecaprenyl-diphosphatase